MDEYEFYEKFGSSVPTSKLLNINIGDKNLVFEANRMLPQAYPRTAPSGLYQFNKGKWENVIDRYAEDLKMIGMINDAELIDFDQDGDDDLLLAIEWGSIKLIENTGTRLVDVSEKYGFHKLEGWWQSITGIDINADGRMDFLAGNIGLNTKYKATEKKPLKVFSDDFNGDGINDCVLSYSNDGEYVPLRGRECSSQQMPFILDSFPTYDLFATASVEDIYGEKLEYSEQKQATTFESKLFLNKPKDGFEEISLPFSVQEFPVLDAVPFDLNQDGNQDLILGGNIYQTEPETPRLDSGKGLVLINQGNNEFKVDAIYSVDLSGDTKDLEVIQIDTKHYLLCTQNNGLLRTYELPNK